MFRGTLHIHVKQIWQDSISDNVGFTIADSRVSSQLFTHMFTVWVSYVISSARNSDVSRLRLILKVSRDGDL